MKDRQFLTLLGLVVVTGLVLGLIAFRVTAGSPPPPTAVAGAAPAAQGTAPSTGTTGSADLQSEAPPQTADTGTTNGEPSSTAPGTVITAQ